MSARTDAPVSLVVTIVLTSNRSAVRLCREGLRESLHRHVLDGPQSDLLLWSLLASEVQRRTRQTLGGKR